MISTSLITLSLMLVSNAQNSDPSMSSSAMDGMDMGGMASGGMMSPWLHFTLGDALWFKSWVPQSKGALVGAAFGLFLLAIVERWFASMRALMELHWREQMLRQGEARFTRLRDEKTDDKCEEVKANVVAPPKSPQRSSSFRVSAPFILTHNVVRGVMFAISAALGYLFMLAVMTYQGAFIISIVAGLGIGEIIFGRFASMTHIAGH